MWRFIGSITLMVFAAGHAYAYCSKEISAKLRYEIQKELGGISGERLSSAPLASDLAAICPSRYVSLSERQQRQLKRKLYTETLALILREETCFEPSRAIRLPSSIEGICKLPEAAKAGEENFRCFIAASVKTIVADSVVGIGSEQGLAKVYESLRNKHLNGRFTEDLRSRCSELVKTALESNSDASDMAHPSQRPSKSKQDSSPAHLVH